MTIRQAIWVVMEQAGWVSDDAPDERLAIAYLDLARSAVLPKYVETEGLSPDYIRVETCLTVRRTPIDCLDCAEEQYVELPYPAFDLPRSGGGIIAAFRPRPDGLGPGVSIPMSNTLEAGLVRNFRFSSGVLRARPAGGRLYLDGAILPKNTKIEVHFIPSSINDIDIDGPFPAPAIAVDLAIRMAKGEAPEDMINDGIDNKSARTVNDEGFQ